MSPTVGHKHSEWRHGVSTGVGCMKVTSFEDRRSQATRRAHITNAISVRLAGVHPKNMPRSRALVHDYTVESQGPGHWSGRCAPGDRYSSGDRPGPGGGSSTPGAGSSTLGAGSSTPGAGSSTIGAGSLTPGAGSMIPGSGLAVRRAVMAGPGCVAGPPHSRGRPRTALGGARPDPT